MNVLEDVRGSAGDGHGSGGMAISRLGSGLSAADHHEDALSVKRARLSLMRRNGASEHNILALQSNLATTYACVGRLEEALRLRRDVHLGFLRLLGEDHGTTVVAGSNYALSLHSLKRFGGVKSLLRKTLPVAQRGFGEGDAYTLRMRMAYAMALYEDGCATLDDLHEAVKTLEETARTAERVLGGAHPMTEVIEESLQESRAVLDARESGRDRGDIESLFWTLRKWRRRGPRKAKQVFVQTQLPPQQTRSN